MRQAAGVAVYRLPGVFGKWCRSNYNSVVATFCHNVANGLQISVNDPDRALRLVHVDDVAAEFIRWIQDPGKGLQSRLVLPEYTTTPGQLAAQIREFMEMEVGLREIGGAQLKMIEVTRQLEKRGLVNVKKIPIGA